MPNQEARTVARKFVDLFICIFGMPYEIISDQGTQYESELFKELCELLGIDKTRTTGYHPNSNGLVERFNRTLENIISHYVSEDQRDWDVHIPLMMLAYRTTPQESTWISPYKMMFGREATLPIDLLLGRSQMQENSQVEACEYVDELRTKLEDSFQLAREHLKSSAERQKRMIERSQEKGSTLGTRYGCW